MQAHQTPPRLAGRIPYWAVSAVALVSALFSALFTLSLSACATAACRVGSAEKRTLDRHGPLRAEPLVERYRLHDGS
jgi:hypothetical protein